MARTESSWEEDAGGGQILSGVHSEASHPARIKALPFVLGVPETDPWLIITDCTKVPMPQLAKMLGVGGVRHYPLGSAIFFRSDERKVRAKQER